MLGAAHQQSRVAGGGERGEAARVSCPDAENVPLIQAASRHEGTIVRSFQKLPAN